MLSPKNARSEAIQRIRDRLKGAIEQRFRDLLPNGESVLELVEQIEAVSQAYAGSDAGAVREVMNRFYENVLALLATLQTRLEEAQEQKAEAEATRDVALMQVGEIQKDTEQALGQRSRELSRVETRQRALEEAVREGDSGLLRSFSGLAKKLTSDLDELLEEGQNLVAETRRITADARVTLPDMERQFVGVEERTAKLSEQAAPLRVRRMSLTADDCSKLEALTSELAQLQNEYQTMQGFAEELGKDFRAAKERFDKWERSFTELRPLLNAAELLFPHLGSEFFTLADTTREAVAGKRSRCGKLLEVIRQGMEKARLETSQREASFCSSLERVKTQHTELAELHELLDMPWFDGLSEEEQELIRAILFAFPEPGARPSLLHLSYVLTAAKLISDPSEREERLAGFIRLPFFSQFGDSRFGLHRLTELGVYWRARWKRELSDLWTRLETAQNKASDLRAAEEEERAEAKTRREAERQQRQRQKEEEAVEKAREQEAREAERCRPQAILAQFSGELEQQILMAASLRGTLPYPRDAQLWARFLAAAQASGLVRQATPNSAVRALRKILSFEPSLFTLEKKEGGRILVWNETGQEVYRNLGTPLGRGVSEFEELCGRGWRYWLPGDVERVKNLRPVLEGALRDIPLENFGSVEE